MRRSTILPTHVHVIELRRRPGGGSDRSLKKNITELTTALKSILSLRPVTWNWKTDQHNKDLRYGFIAQEVETVLPHLVTMQTWQDGTARKFLSTYALLPYLVGAIKEQQKQIDTLQCTVKKLQKSPSSHM